MKRYLKILPAIFALLVSLQLFPQGPPPPPPGNGHGQTTSQLPEGGNAAIGGGVFLLSLLGAGYGIRKYFKIRNAD